MNLSQCIFIVIRILFTFKLDVDMKIFCIHRFYYHFIPKFNLKMFFVQHYFGAIKLFGSTVGNQDSIANILSSHTYNVSQGLFTRTRQALALVSVRHRSGGTRGAENNNNLPCMASAYYIDVSIYASANLAKIQAILLRIF